jgi:hypothetical protein
MIGEGVFLNLHPSLFVVFLSSLIKAPKGSRVKDMIYDRGFKRAKDMVKEIKGQGK